MNFIALPWLNALNHPWLSWIFATDDDSSNQDDIFNEFDANWDAETGDDPDEKNEKKEEKNEDDSTAAQKKHWREKAKSAEAKVKELETKLKGAVDKKDEGTGEKKAEAYLRNLMTQLLDAREKEATEKAAARQAQLDEELSDLVEENPELTKKQIGDAAEEYDVSPSKAVKILKKLAGKEKPNLPKSKRGTGDVQKKEEEKKKPGTWSDALRDAKALLNK